MARDGVFLGVSSLRQVMVTAGLALVLSGGGAGLTAAAHGSAKATTQASASFSWVTSGIPLSNASVDGSPDSSLLASFGQYAGSARPVAMTWETSTASAAAAQLAPDNTYLDGDVVVSSDGTHVFVSGRRIDNTGLCDLFVSSRDGTGKAQVFSGGGLAEPAPCHPILTGDGNRVLVAVDALDPAFDSQAGWYVVDESGNAKRITAVDRSGPYFGTPCAPNVSPNGVDVLVAGGSICGSSPDLSLSIVHLDGRSTTQLVAPNGYHLTGLPLDSDLFGQTRRAVGHELMGQWSSDGSHFATLLTDDLTCALSYSAPCIMRLGILSMDGSWKIVGPNNETALTADWSANGGTRACCGTASPLISQDGTRVAYLTSSSSGISLWVSKLDGSNDQRVNLTLSDLAEIEPAGNNFVVLTYNTAHLGESLWKVSADGTVVTSVRPNNSNYELWTIEASNATTVFVYGWDNLDPSDPNRTDTIYAIDLSGTQAPLRLIPYSEPNVNALVTGVSSDGQRVSGWTMDVNATTWRGWTATLGPPLPVYAVALTPKTGSDTVGSSHALTAHVTQSSSPAASVSVAFAVTSGPCSGSSQSSLTNTSGDATFTYSCAQAGTDTITATVSAGASPVIDTATETWTAPAFTTVLFIQGIGSSSTCETSPDFVGRISWLRSSVASVLPSTRFLYYAYRSPYTSNPSCSNPAVPRYSNLDSCWSLDDVYAPLVGRARDVPGGGQATRLAAYLKSYLDANPGETISVVTHSQGGVLASYVVKQKLSPTYASRIQSIITLDSPLLGINGAGRALLRAASGCSNGDKRLDSAFDMDPTSAIIRRINDADRPSTMLYTVDADPGAACSRCGFPLIDDAHSTTWWATAHIRVAAATHSDIWNGCFQQSTGTVCAGSNGLNLQSQGRKLVRFTACAIGNLAADCKAYSEQ